MKTVFLIVLGGLLVVGGFFAFNSYIYHEKQGEGNLREGVTANTPANALPEVIPIEHATFVLRWGEEVMYVDPTGGSEAFSGQPAPTLVLVTDIHGDHLSTSTIEAVLGNATLIVPRAVYDRLPSMLQSKATVLANAEIVSFREFSIAAIPMYNLPVSEDARHPRGRGNGYVIERGDYSVYVAGDTAGIPEMRALRGIDVAFIPMNLPYTMSVEEAADAVLAFKPKIVYPYHYRTPEGFADVGAFASLVTQGDGSITIEQLDWYKE